MEFDKGQRTEDIFNTGVKTSEINEKDFINLQMETIENIFKKQTTKLLMSPFLYDKSNSVKKMIFDKTKQIFVNIWLNNVFRKCKRQSFTICLCRKTN